MRTLLSARQVAEALRERAQRIYEKYGNVMLDVAGMTKAGIERKATCRALFSKLLFLAGVLLCTIHVAAFSLHRCTSMLQRRGLRCSPHLETYAFACMHIF